MAEIKSGKVNLARKYRPLHFSDLIGQNAVVTILKNIISMGKVSSMPFIFSGPRGVGKTTLARIYARAVNCKKPSDLEPCSECEACRAILDGSAPDIHEIDGASNRGIDEVKDILNQIKFMPSMLKYKIYIIDEAHQITHDAFNALLKVLEEPPEHVVFLFASTELHKFPVTIRSRCLVFNFRLVSVNEVKDRLAQIASEEKLPLSTGVISLLAKAGMGSVRDSISLLEQVSSLGSGKINEEDIARLLGLLPIENLKKIAKTIFLRDTDSALREINAMLNAGFDENQLMIEIQRYLRLAALSRISPGSLGQEGLSSQEISDIGEASAVCSEEDIVRALQIFARNFESMKWSSFPKVWLEMAVIKSSRGYIPVEELISGKTISVPEDTPLPEPRTETVVAGDDIFIPPPQDERESLQGNEASALLKMLEKKFPRAHAFIVTSPLPIAFDGKKLSISFDNKNSMEFINTNALEISDYLSKKLSKPLSLETKFVAPEVSISGKSAAGNLSPKRPATLDAVLEKDGIINKIIKDFSGDVIDGIG